jgi:hypothetical protein
MVLLGTAMQPQLLEPVGGRVVRGDHHATVAPGSEILAGEERIARHPPELTRDAPFAVDLAARADRLRRVFNQLDAARLRDRHQLEHVGHLAVQVHGHDRAGARRDRALHRGGIDVERVRLNVHEHRCAAGIVDRAGRREERERRGNDFVARRQVQRLERQEQRIGAARAADAVLGVRHARDLDLELRHRGPHDELLRLDDFHHRRQHIVLDRLVLSNEIQHGDVHDAPAVAREGLVCRRNPDDSSYVAPHTPHAARPALGCSRSPHWHIQPTRRAGTPTISP